jgi:hypothetical protein
VKLDVLPAPLALGSGGGGGFGSGPLEGMGLVGSAEAFATGNANNRVARQATKQSCFFKGIPRFLSILEKYGLRAKLFR